MAGRAALARRAARAAALQLAPRLAQIAPDLTSSFVREALHRAIAGVGPLPPAAEAAEKQLAEQRGRVDRAVHEVIENHVRWAGAQGFATNLGGLATMTVAVPANLMGLAVLQCRMVAGIAHLRGYDLADPGTRNAILLTLLGPDRVEQGVAGRRLPGTPFELAAELMHDPAVDELISVEVAAELVSRIAGKRVAGTIGRRVPLVGGVVGMSADAYATWRIGRYADRELPVHG